MLHFNISCNSATCVMSLALILQVKFLLSTCKNMDWILGHSFQNYVWKLQRNKRRKEESDETTRLYWGHRTHATKRFQNHFHGKRGRSQSLPDAWCCCGGNHRVIVHARPRRKTFPCFRQHCSSRRGPLLLGFILGTRCSQFHSASRWENNDPTGMTSWF